MTIKFFVKENGFLSNFYVGKNPILYQGFYYKSLEHAYQAAKQTLVSPADLEYRTIIKNAHTPGKAKRLGQQAILMPDWATKRIDIMAELISIKFSDKYLKYLLKETKPVDLEEGNYWHDNFWGVCYCKKCNGIGLNNHGKLLMDERDRNESRL